MKKLKIGIDIDNVIADSYPSFLSNFNKVFATRIKYEEIYDFYYLEKHTGISHIETKKFINRILVDEEIQLNIPPYKDVQKILSAWIKAGHKIHYITSRPNTTRDITYKWLEKHGFLHPGTTLDLFNAAQHFDKHRKVIMEYKKTIAQNRGVELFIEDSKEIAETMEIPVLLLDRPWNKGKLKKNIKRVRDWSEIDKFVGKS